MAGNSNINPIIAIAGKGSQYVESLVYESKGDTVINYRDGAEATVKKMKSGLGQTGHTTVQHALELLSFHRAQRS